MELITKIFLIIIASAIIGSIIGYADADKIRLINIRITDDKPTICFVEPQSNQYYNQTQFLVSALTGVSTWEYKLERFTKLSWDMDYKLISYDDSLKYGPRDFTTCDVFFYFDFTPNYKQIGIVKYFTNSSKHDYSIINIYPVYILNNKTNYISYQDLQVVVSHEFGHALGLLHWEDTNKYNFKSVMNPYHNSNLVIGPHDLVAVLNHYCNFKFEERYSCSFKRFYGQ